MPTSTIVRRTLRDSAFLGVLIALLLLVGSVRLAGTFVAGAGLAWGSFFALALTVERSTMIGMSGGAAGLLLTLVSVLKLSLVGMIFVLIVKNDGPGAVLYLCGLSTVPFAACVAGFREGETRGSESNFEVVPVEHAASEREDERR